MASNGTVSDGTKGPIAITGIPPKDPSKPPSRLELRDLRRNNPDQWNLFLLGMERFMDKKVTPEDHPLSYYQIAGIHGLPWDKWPNKSWNDERTAYTDAGYCTHSSILFLPWHRPFLSLFETQLHKHMEDIAKEFDASEGRDRYIKAAVDFRLPYWDWARPTDHEVTIFPTEVWAATKHNVIRPKSGNKSTTIDPNPLAGYQFGDLGQKYVARNGKGQPIRRQNGALYITNLYPKVNKTLRHPNAAGTASETSGAVSDLQKFFEEQGASKGKNLTERTLYILQSYDRFAAMSSNRFMNADESKWENAGSLEDIHNAVHDYTGGGGHMSDPAIAAFDPIFWLHHCNIDRLFAIWQALHGDYVTPQTNDKSWTRTISFESKKTAETKLAPFTASEKKGDYWDSVAVKDTTTFGYVYPETQSWIYNTPEAIKEQLSLIYHGSFANTMAKSGDDFESDIAELQSRAKFHQQVSQVESLNTPIMLQAVQTNAGVLPPKIAEQVQATVIQPPKKRDVKDLIVDNKYLEWLVDLRAQKHAAGGDFVVHVFLGPPEDNEPGLYVSNPNHVATFSAFGQDSNTKCEKCQQDQANSLLVTGQIPLTLALVERYLAGLVEGLDVTSVENYLTQNLHWRVTTTMGQPLTRDQVADLKVAVVTNEVTLPDTPTGLPRYSPEVVPRPAITTNRDGSGRGDGTGWTDS